MILVALLIGVVLIVSAVRNSHAALFSALSTDVPEFVIWAAAILAVGAIGFVPGLSPISRGLLALIIVVIVLNNYQNIITGFQNAGNAATVQGASNAAGASAVASTVAPPASSSAADLATYLADTANAFGGG